MILNLIDLDILRLTFVLMVPISIAGRFVRVLSGRVGLLKHLSGKFEIARLNRLALNRI